MKMLKELRLKEKKTQQEIADFLGISYQAYAHYETGRRQPDPQTIITLANYFNVSTDCILGLNYENLSTQTERTNRLIEKSKKLTDNQLQNIENIIDNILDNKK